MKNSFNLFLMATLLGLVILTTSCATGNGVEESTESMLQDLDGEGVPDIYDNCPSVPNTPDVVVGIAPIACVVAMDCYLDPATLADGTLVPVATNPQGSSPVGIYCIEDVCMMQADNELDGAGDACDMDDDNDKIADTADNCPTDANTDQLNTDGDTKGDVCDADDDNDGVLDGDDNCPLVENPGQEDTDGDGEGDACEDDADGDGVLNDDDNCPLIANPDQIDTDLDGEGDACDTDDDGDGDPDVSDCMPLDPNIYTDADELCNGIDDNCDGVVDEDFDDTDADGTADCMDLDDDNDTILDDADNCPLIPNPDQKDMDGDGLGDFCDDDMDGDGVLNTEDNCLMVSNPVSDCDDDPLTADEQCDTDLDGLGDACDNDCDGDGVLNGEDETSGCKDIDLDGDGYLFPEDCLEGNWDVNPGADELCDGVDDNCDGVVDNEVIDCAVGQACIAGQCVVEECVLDIECDDDNICTTDTCVGGACGSQSILDCCEVDADCVGDQTCVDNICTDPVPEPPVGECENDAGCLPGQYCAGGTCAPFVDLHGETPYGVGGANGGPNNDGTPDDWDDDGDGYCETAPCVGSANPDLLVENLLGGDCDDNPSDSQSQIDMGTFMTDPSIYNHPGAQEWCEAFPGFDNDCDGTPNDGC